MNGIGRTWHTADWVEDPDVAALENGKTCFRLFFIKQLFTCVLNGQFDNERRAAELDNLSIEL